MHHLDKYKQLKPEAADRIQEIVEDITLKTKLIFKESLKTPKVSDPRVDIDEDEYELLRTMERKIRKVVKKVIELVLTNRPAQKDFECQTALSNTAIAQMEEDTKFNAIEQISNRRNKTKLSEWEKKIGELTSKLKAAEVENARM